MAIIGNGYYESDRIEFKRELNNKLERSIVAFLNSKEGGVLYIGVDDDGSIYGVSNADAAQLAVIDRIKNNILPTTLGLFDIATEFHDGKIVIKIIVSSGAERPYYLKEYGMSPKGCFTRIGSGVQPMTTVMIDNMYMRRNRLTLVNMPSPRQNLTFTQLRYYYEAKGLTLGQRFEETLDLVDENGNYNYAAYLLADENGVSIKVAKYAGKDKVNLIENEEYGYCCLLKATDRILEKMLVENRTFAKITPKTRLEKKMINPKALSEAVINGIVHNDYSQEVPPVVEIYSDRLTITSNGGLMDNFTEEDFFHCISKPRNRVLMRVFKDAGMVEQLGSGVSRILSAYDKSVFHFTPNYLVVTFPFAEGFTTPNVDESGVVNGDINGDVNSSKNLATILELINKNPTITQGEITTETGIPTRTVSRAVKKLRDEGVLQRVGSAKTGHWKVTQR